MQQPPMPLFGIEFFPVLANKVHVTFEFVAIDDDLDDVAVMQFSNGAAGQGFRGNMANTRPRRNTTESSVRDNSHMFAERQMLERRSNLIGLFHTGAERPTA